MNDENLCGEHLNCVGPPGSCSCPRHLPAGLESVDDDNDDDTWADIDRKLGSALAKTAEGLDEAIEIKAKALCAHWLAPVPPNMTEQDWCDRLAQRLSRHPVNQRALELWGDHILRVGRAHLKAAGLPLRRW